MSSFYHGAKRFGATVVILMLMSVLAQIPVSGAGETYRTRERFDEGTAALDLYLDKDGTQVSFTLPSEAKVIDAKMKVSGVLPPQIQRYSVGSAPMAIAYADVDKDGDMDIGVTNSKADTVSILFNDGHGRFDKTQPLDLLVGREPSDLVFADLDRDGNMDLAVVNSTDGAVTVRLTKTELLGSATTYKVGGNLGHVMAGDLDNDTYPDLVVVRKQYPVLAILFSRGDGTFNPPTDVQVLASPEGAAMTDVDGDGLLDIVVASTDRPYSVIIVKNKGGKNLDEGEKYGLEWPPSDLVAADLTGDGRQDLVAPSVQGNMSVLINTGAGYGTPMVIRCSKLQAVTAGDLNNDGMVDVVSASRWDSAIRTFVNKGAGSLALDQIYISGSSPTALLAVDLDGDGDLDIATAEYSADSVAVAMNNGRGRFTWTDMYDIIESDKMVTMGDLDGDGDLDLVSANYAYQSISIAYNKGKGEFTKVSKRPGYMVYVGGSGGSEPFYPTVADYDGDHDNDIQYTEELSNAVIMMFNDGNGVFREDSVAHEFGKNLLPAPAYVTLPVDVNKDGSLDIICTHMNWDFISVLLNDGTGHFYKRINHSLDGSHAYDIAAEDFDRDGKMDFITANYGVGQDYESDLTFIRNDGNGNLTNVMKLALKKGPKSLALADMNGDGRRDIIVSFAAKKSLTEVLPGEIAVILADVSPLQYKEPMYYRTGVMPSKVYPGDLNDDNKPDIICLNQETSGDGSMSIFINNGDGTLKPQIEYPDVPFKYSAFGDLNGDDRAEVVVPVLGSYVQVHRALYYPGNIVLSGPSGENLWVNPGVFQVEQEVNLTSSLSAFMDGSKEDGGNVTYHMNLTAGRAGVARVSGLVVKYKIPLPATGENNKGFSVQGTGIMLVMLGILVIVALVMSSSKAPAQEEKVPVKPSGKGKGKKRQQDETLSEPGPVIVRKPQVRVKAEKEDWDKPRKDKGKTGKRTGPVKMAKPASIKVEVQKGDWRPSKTTIEHSKFEKAAEMRDDIKKETKYKKKKNGK